jgi:hypothetical protein
LGASAFISFGVYSNFWERRQLRQRAAAMRTSGSRLGLRARHHGI